MAGILGLNAFQPASNPLALAQQQQAASQFNPTSGEMPQLSADLISQGMQGAGGGTPMAGGFGNPLDTIKADAGAIGSAVQNPRPTWDHLMQQYGHLLPKAAAAAPAPAAPRPAGVLSPQVDNRFGGLLGS